MNRKFRDGFISEIMQGVCKYNHFEMDFFPPIEANKINHFQRKQIFDNVVNPLLNVSQDLFLYVSENRDKSFMDKWKKIVSENRGNRFKLKLDEKSYDLYESFFFEIADYSIMYERVKIGFLFKANVNDLNFIDIAKKCYDPTIVTNEGSVNPKALFPYAKKVAQKEEDAILFSMHTLAYESVSSISVFLNKKVIKQFMEIALMNCQLNEWYCNNYIITG